MTSNEDDITMDSFTNPVNAAVIGASGGIGGAFVEALAANPKVARVAAFSRAQLAFADPKVTAGPIDLEDEASIEAAARQAEQIGGRYHLVIVATGILHGSGGLQPEKTWRALDAGAMDRVFRLNTVGPALAAKHFLPLLAKDDKAVFAALSARVGSIGDNSLGGWHAYRASKAALNMLLKNFAIELARRNAGAVVVGLHPGTVDTSLSQPFQGGVPAGKLFSPAQSAGYLLNVLDGVTPEDSGRVFAWDGKPVPY